MLLRNCCWCGRVLILRELSGDPVVEKSGDVDLLAERTEQQRRRKRKGKERGRKRSERNGMENNTLARPYDTIIKTKTGFSFSLL